MCGGEQIDPVHNGTGSWHCAPAEVVPDCLSVGYGGHGPARQQRLDLGREQNASTVRSPIKRFDSQAIASEKKARRLRPKIVNREGEHAAESFKACCAPAPIGGE